MSVKQSTFRKAKDNIRFIIHPMFLVIILLTSGNSFIAFFFFLYRWQREELENA